MSSMAIVDDPSLSAAPHPPRSTDILVCLPSTPADLLPASFDAVAAAFPGENVLVAACERPEDLADFPSLEIVAYPSPLPQVGWVLAAGDYAAASHLAVDRGAQVILTLGDTAAPIRPELLRSLADIVRSRNVDLVLPRFTLGPNDGLVNSALLYPLSRALFGADIHFPLAVTAALSARMAKRLNASTQRLVNVNQGSTLVWPVAEAAIAGYSVREIPAGDVPPPPPPQEDFNALFTSIASSLFADIDAKANFWQRARTSPVRPCPQPILPTIESWQAPDEITSMVESFRLAQNNLQEIWSLVLSPQTRLALKKLAHLPDDSFKLEPELWARVVYDFTLAYHLRTLNRNHLLGAMTPLYLAWVASHLRFVADDPARAARAIEDTACAFEVEKSYIVSRWRWPDRFNP